MRIIRPLVVLALAASTLPALSQVANCSNGTRLNRTQLDALLAGNALVCGRPGPSYPGAATDRWQEEHIAGGTLFDYKLGPGPGPDPRTQVGTWAAAGVGGNATLTHTYDASAFTWTVHGPNSNNPGTSIYFFCSGGQEFARAFVRYVSTGCAGSYPL